MNTESTITACIEKSATIIGPVWPIHSFVTTNPLAGFEDVPFREAVTQASALWGGRGYPSSETFQAVLDNGQIDPDILESELAKIGYDANPETLLNRMESGADSRTLDPTVERVNQILTKWLSAFLDEGSATWSMPNREDGFYTAFRSVAEFDSEIPDDGIIADLPEKPIGAIEAVLAPYPKSQWVPIFEEQLASLPGWTGFIKQRADTQTVWQSTYPITLPGYLAIRLSLLDSYGTTLEPSPGPDRPECNAADELAEAFLTAWEASYRSDVVEHIGQKSQSITESEDTGRPDAQLVFCIDTRSEIIRRHIEEAGEYETHGYAGFFGIPMKYQGYDADVPINACPPILDPQHHIIESPSDTDAQASHDRWVGVRNAASDIIASLKSNPSTAFSFVENAGSVYGLALIARTLVPHRIHDIFDTADSAVPAAHEFCEQIVQHQYSYVDELPVGVTHEEKVEYAASAFELMGWEEFSRLVVFAGHASETTNNPYDSSLDCGACAGNPGGPNARVLAAICNDAAVKTALRARGFAIPDDTVFVAGEHNTTTDEIELYTDHVPESHRADLAQLQAALATAREAATEERAESLAGEGSLGLNEMTRRAGDWAETRPEWGIAGNAGFVIGPRELTSDLNLDGRVFLHSYDWSTDPDGDALEEILTGPMVVTQWINTQYYFSTIDNAVYGSGSKVTQNPVGNIGVFQGNGGDLMTGLPAQSVLIDDEDPYHQPLRLSTVIHAPVKRVTGVLVDNEKLIELLDNDWLSLVVVDPTQGHRAFLYQQELEWTPLAGQSGAQPDMPNAPTVGER